MEGKRLNPHQKPKVKQRTPSHYKPQPAQNNQLDRTRQRTGTERGEKLRMNINGHSLSMNLRDVPQFFSLNSVPEHVFFKKLQMKQIQPTSLVPVNLATDVKSKYRLIT